MVGKRAGQASIDYLMTYGWAILIIILVAAALFVMGIFDVNREVGNKPVGFTEIGVAAFQFKSNGTMLVRLRNQAGKKIDITNVTAFYSGRNVSSEINVSNLGIGTVSETVNVGSFGTQREGDSYTMGLKIIYHDREYNYSYIQSGTINGYITQ